MLISTLIEGVVPDLKGPSAQYKDIVTFLSQDICTCWPFYLEHVSLRYSLVHILISTGPLLKRQDLREVFLHNPIWCWTSPPFPVTFYIHFPLTFSSFFLMPFILLIYFTYCLSFPIEWKFQKGEDFGVVCCGSVIIARNQVHPIVKCSRSVCWKNESGVSHGNLVEGVLNSACVCQGEASQRDDAVLSLRLAILDLPSANTVKDYAGREVP